MGRVSDQSTPEPAPARAEPALSDGDAPEPPEVVMLESEEIRHSAPRGDELDT